MKIALIGYGNMGKEVERIVKNSPHSIVSINYKNPSDPLDMEGIKKADVAIDFTSASIILGTIQKVLPYTKMVIGTTGWYDKLPLVEEMVKKEKGAIIYGQNFSIGANIFFRMIEFASKLASEFGDYDAAGFEIHHTGKKDSPSGTAKKLSQIIMENFPKKKKLETGRLDRQIEKDELHFASLRTGRYFGYHEVLFDSSSDEIKLSHNAHSRQGFAEGAILAAEFIKDKKGFYSFDDVFRMEEKK